jgi:hypothetical protein
MTDTTAGVLAGIDGALAAYGTVDYGDTGDSMRWRPETPRLVICDDGRPLPLARWSPPFAEADISQNAAWQTFTARMEAFAAGMAKALLAIHDLHAAMDPCWHKRQCRECHPRGNPGALAVNGREHRRRFKNRRKRR